MTIHGAPKASSLAPGQLYPHAACTGNHSGAVPQPSIWEKAIMISKLNTAVAATTLLVSALLSAPVYAQAPRGESAIPNQVVRYSDLDLSTAAGVRTLYQRIQNAAFSVCHDMVPATNGPTGIENSKCRQSLVEAAVGQVNNPALTALHSGKPKSDLTASR
jgi:UrcA family protein